jgi:hypothetical protein
MPSHSLSYWFEHFNHLKPTGHVMHQQFNIQQLYALSTLFLCFVFIWEQIATCATYSINWLVFITEMKSVYSAVRTWSFNKAVCASSLKVLIIHGEECRSWSYAVCCLHHSSFTSSLLGKTGIIYFVTQ